MEFHKRIFHAFLLLFFISLHSNASSIYTFKRISVPEGLSQTTVYSICQDSLGYVWIGTQDGLNKYNGHNMVTYESDSQDTTTLSSSFVKSLFVDCGNNIWVGGLSSISRYSYEQDCFKRYKLPNIGNRSEMNNICSDKDRVWASSQIGELYVCNRNSDSFIPVVYQQEGVTKRVSIQKMRNIGNYLYLCGFNGFYRLNKQNYQLELLFLNESYSEIHDFVFDANNEVWLGTKEKGLLHLDSRFRLKEQFVHTPHANSIVGDKIRALSVNHSGEILIGTYFGLSVFNPSTAQFQNYMNSTSSPSVLSSNSVLTIFTDKDNGIWIGTSLGGGNYYHQENNKFSCIQSNGEPRSLINNMVNCIVQQKDHLWIGYNDNGISCLDTQTNRMEHYLTDNRGKPISVYKNIRSILPLPDGSLLLGSLFGGLVRFNPRTKQMNTFTEGNTPYSLKDNRISTLYGDSRGNIWVGTYNGLFKFDIKTSRFYPFEELYPFLALTSKEIICMIEDSRKMLWIGTVNGLNRCDPIKKEIVRFIHNAKDTTSVTSNRISAIYEDASQQIWIGTSKGLNMFRESTNSFTHLTSKEGLLNDMVLAIIEDNDKNLWVSNNKGLTKVVPKTFYCESFTKEDGLGDQQLIAQSAVRLPNGTLMFGGINGITSFNPWEVGHSQINKKVLFSDLYIGEQRIRPYDNTGILSAHIAQTKEIELNYNKDFSIAFSAVNFNQQSFTYQYKLEGYNTSWVVTNQNRVSFYNLDEGEYTLSVKVVSLNNAINEQFTTLRITILPPWWKSFWMYLIYVSAFVAIVYLVYLRVQRKIQIKNEKLVNIIEKEKLKEFQEMRQQLFVNISHELKTPLSLIISPLQELYRQVLIDKRTRMHIDMAYTNSRKLNDLVNQLIDFSKTEQNDISLTIQEGNLRNALYKVYLSFLTIATAKEIQYDFHSEEKSENVSFDPYIIERVLTNLLSNAFKFTPNKGMISVTLTYGTEHCCISVADSGVGISKEEAERVFDRYYTTLSKSGGSGIGLAFVKHLVTLHKGDIAIQSERGKGAVFTVNIPVNLPVNKEPSLVKVEKKLVINDEVPEQNTCIAGNKILIVDDNVDMVRYLQDYYAQTNDVVVAYNGSQAIEQLSGNVFDIIISDVMMPDIDGLTLCRKVKHSPETSNISFILLTALSDTEFIIKGIYSGADDYITKPFSFEVLDAKLDRMNRLKKKRAEQANQEIFADDDAIYTSLEQEFIQKVTEVINAHLEDTEYRIQDLANELCMSPSKLNRKFMSMIGKSPIEFIRKIRLQRAVTLLDTQQYSVSEVCYMVGFATPTYFSVCFKKEFGYSPSSYVPMKTK